MDLCGQPVCAFTRNELTTPCYVHDDDHPPGHYSSLRRPLISIDGLNHTVYAGRFIYYYIFDTTMMTSYITSHWHMVNESGHLIDVHPCYDKPPNAPPPPPPPLPPEMHAAVSFGVDNGTACNGVRLLTVSFPDANASAANESAAAAPMPVLAHDDDSEEHPLFQSHAFLPVRTFPGVNASKEAGVSDSVSVISVPKHDSSLNYVKVNDRWVYTKLHAAANVHSPPWRFVSETGDLFTCAADEAPPTAWLGTQEVSCGTALTFRRGYYDPPSLLYVHTLDLALNNNTVPLFDSTAFSLAAVKHHVLSDASMPPAPNSILDHVSLVPRPTENLVKIFGYFVYVHTVGPIDWNAWTFLQPSGALGCAPAPPAAPPCVVNTCFNDLDSQHLLANCSTIIQIGTLDCTNNELRGLCAKECGLCTIPDNLCEESGNYTAPPPLFPPHPSPPTSPPPNPASPPPPGTPPPSPPPPMPPPFSPPRSPPAMPAYFGVLNITSTDPGCALQLLTTQSGKFLYFHELDNQATPLYDSEAYPAVKASAIASDIPGLNATIDDNDYVKINGLFVYLYHLEVDGATPAGAVGLFFSIQDDGSPCLTGCHRPPSQPRSPAAPPPSPSPAGPPPPQSPPQSPPPPSMPPIVIPDTISYLPSVGLLVFFSAIFQLCVMQTRAPSPEVLLKQLTAPPPAGVAPPRDKSASISFSTKFERAPLMLKL